MSGITREDRASWDIEGFDKLAKEYIKDRMMNIRDTLKERGDRYGAFTLHAQICQDLKETMKNTPSWDGMTPDKKQALEVIADKIARMLNGDPDYDDNWIDIIGYSQLVLDELHKDAVGQTKIDFEVDDYLAKTKRNNPLETCKYGDISPNGKEIWDGDGPVPIRSLEGQAVVANMKVNLNGHETGDQ